MLRAGLRQGGLFCTSPSALGSFSLTQPQRGSRNPQEPDSLCFPLKRSVGSAPVPQSWTVRSGDLGLHRTVCSDWGWVVFRAFPPFPHTLRSLCDGQVTPKSPCKLQGSPAPDGPSWCGHKNPKPPPCASPEQVQAELQVDNDT